MALQRTLFRMQLDPAFAASLRRRDPEAVHSADLSSRELGWLCEADPAAVAADRGGARRAQFLRNVAGEFSLTVSVLGPSALDSFPSSAAFHDAVRAARSLPLALGQHLLARTEPESEARELIALETAMASARRTLREQTTPRGDEVALAPWVHLLRVRSGTLERATRLRQASPGESAASLGRSTETETLLLLAEAGAPPFRLREVHVEALPTALALFLEEARRPLSRTDRSAWAAQAEADPSDLERAVQELRQDGVLIAASDEPS